MILQTTVGKVLCEDTKYKETIYVFFNRLSHEAKITSDFKDQFQSKNSENKLKSFTRQECLKHFEIEENEDDVVVIQNILKSPKLNQGTVIFFDETSIERPNKSYDWSMLQNPRPEVTAIVSFQPLQEANSY